MKIYKKIDWQPLLTLDGAKRYCSQFAKKDFDNITSYFTQTRVKIRIITEIKKYYQMIKDFDKYDKNLKLTDLCNERIIDLKNYLIKIT